LILLKTICIPAVKLIFRLELEKIFIPQAACRILVFLKNIRLEKLGHAFQVIVFEYLF